MEKLKILLGAGQWLEHRVVFHGYGYWWRNNEKRVIHGVTERLVVLNHVYIINYI